MSDYAEFLRQKIKLASFKGFDVPLEQHIKDCGHVMETALAEGRADDAQLWMAAMYAAIEARSPEQRARMLAEIETRISEGNCYFMAVGAEHAAEMSLNVKGVHRALLQA